MLLFKEQINKYAVIFGCLLFFNKNFSHLKLSIKEPKIVVFLRLERICMHSSIMCNFSDRCNI